MFLYFIVYYLCCIVSAVNCFKLHLKVNFSKEELTSVHLIPHFTFQLNGSIIKEITSAEKSVLSNCTKCQIQIVEEIRNSYLPNKMDFQFTIRTKQSHQNEGIVRRFALTVYKPNFKKVFELNLGNLATIGNVQKDVAFGEIIPENTILFGALSVEMNQFDSWMNGRISEIDLGSDQCKTVSSNKPLTSGNFNFNVNFEELHNPAGEIGQINLKIFKFIQLKNEQNDGSDYCQICLTKIKENEQILQIHPINNNYSNRNEKHLSHLHCMLNWIKADHTECPLCGLKFIDQKLVKLQPFLSETDQHEAQGILHWNYQQMLINVLDEVPIGTFKHRQAAGALNAIKEYIGKLNAQIDQLFGGFQHKLEMRNGKMLAYKSVNNVKNLLQRILAIESGEQSEHLLNEVENVNGMLEHLAKEAFDTIEMVKEEDAEE